MSMVIHIHSISAPLSTWDIEFVDKAPLGAGGNISSFRPEKIRIRKRGQTSAHLVCDLPEEVDIPGWALADLLPEESDADLPEKTKKLSPSAVAAFLATQTNNAQIQYKAQLLNGLRRLETIEVNWGDHDFLNLPSTAAISLQGEAKLFLSRWLLGEAHDGKIAEFSIRSNAQFGLINVSHALACVFRLTGEPTLRLDLDDFNLSLPEFAFPNLDFSSSPKLDWPTSNVGASRLFARFLEKFPNKVTATIAPDPATPAPQLYLNFDANKGLQWALASQAVVAADWSDPAQLQPTLATFQATISFGANPITIPINDLRAASFGGGQAHIEGTIGGTAELLRVSSPESSAFGPFEIITEGLVITAEVGPNNANNLDNVLVAKVKFERLTIRLLDDPTSFIHLKGEVWLTPSAVTIKHLEIIQPYPLTLVSNAANALLRSLQSIVSFVGKIDISTPTAPDIAGLKKLFDVLGKFASAIARTTLLVGNAIADFANTVGRAVADALVALADSLGQLLGQIGKLIPDAPNGAIQMHFEVRLALEPFELRQILITSSSLGNSDAIQFSAAGLEISIDPGWQPGLLIDFVEQPGAYLIVSKNAIAATETQFASLGTDLWLKGKSGVSSVRDASSDSGERNVNKRLISLSASFKSAKDEEVVVVLAGLKRGSPVFLQRLSAALESPSGVPNVKIMSGRFTMTPLSNALTVKVNFDEKRILPLLGMGETGKTQTTGFLDDLKNSLGQVVWVESSKSSIKPGTTSVELDLMLGIKAAGVQTSVKLTLTMNLTNLQVSLGANMQKIAIKSRRIEQRALGLNWVIEQKDAEKRKTDEEIEMFFLDFVDGETSFSLNQEVARMELHFDALSPDGKGVVFEVNKFAVGRRGVDIDANVSKNPVVLNGINMPFQFHEGSLSIAASRLVQAKIAGRGSLPKDLIGDADCTVALAFAQESSGIVLQSGKVEIDKKGEPIVCHSTRFTLTINDIDIGFQQDNGYHFYFLVTGSIRFTPKSGEFESGLLGFLKDIEIELDRTPLTGDARVLANHISFQKALSPKKTFNLFNLFKFELRGFGFHPASKQFGGDPALNLSGQIQFAEVGDVAQPKIDFHGLWIAAPKPGEALPRIHCEGLGLELQLPGSVKMRGSMMAVDPDTKTLEGTQIAPDGYKTYGFLGEGELDIPGWGSMQASLGFLEVERIAQPGERRKAFFLYLQKDKLNVKIPTPFWVFYMREAGLGFGFRYTLAGIKDAESTNSPAKLITVLDEISKRQGNLGQFSAWKPDPEGDKFTLALRAALQPYPPPMEVYDEAKESIAESPFFFDLILAIRSDFTLLASMRGWLGVNYATFRKNPNNFRDNPGLRGYLYISVPRSELLARLIGNSRGFIGENFVQIKSGTALRTALQSVDWSATLYIRPGLFHYELGWPDQLAARLIDEEKFKVSVRGGMIFRATADGLLWGYNVEADAWLQFGGSAGGSVGVAIEANLRAKLIARLIAYLSWKFQGSLVYGLISLDASVTFSVRAWMKVDLRFTSFTIKIAFSYSLQLSAAVELAISAEGALPKIGAKIQARVAISAFGCTFGVSVGFGIDPALVESARNRVQGFLAMSLTSEQADQPPLIGAAEGDKRIDEQARQAEAIQEGKLPEKQPTTSITDDSLPPQKLIPDGLCEPIAVTDFWLVLHRAAKENYAYALLLPQEGRGFYCSPQPQGAPPNFVRQATSHLLSLLQEGLAQVKDVVVRNRTSEQKLNAPLIARDMNWDQALQVDSDANVKFIMAELFDECFLTDTEWKYDRSTTPPTPRRAVIKLREPKSKRSYSKAEMPAPNATQAQKDAEREQAQSAHISHAASDPETDRVYQMRSTVLAMFVDQFVKLAQGVQADQWGHVLDTGLVFYGRVDQLEKLAAFMKVGKTDVITPVADQANLKLFGAVKIFNPQTRWFERQDPILNNDRFDLTVNGIQLDWHLSAPWANHSDTSQTENDPEQMLQHYEILRTIEGRESTPRSFKVKRASTMAAREKAGEIEHYLLAPNCQFTDDLSDLAESERRALLPASSADDSLAAALAWIEVFQDQAEVTLTYSVTPVDIAGTYGLSKSFVVDIQRPQAPVRAAEAQLHIVQKIKSTSSFELSEQHPDDLEIYVAIHDPAWEKDADGMTRSYTLILEQEKILPAGYYGSDGMTDRVLGIGSAGVELLPASCQFRFDYQKTIDISNLPDIDPDKENRKRFKRWGILIGVAKFGREQIFTEKEKIAFLNQLWRKDNGPRVATRIWMKTNIELGGQPTLSSRLTPVAIELSIEPTCVKPDKFIQLRPEVFEWPLHLRLPPLPAQVHVQTGFMHLRAPTIDATLQKLLGSDLVVTPLRDPERRTMAVVDFSALPAWGNTVVNGLHKSTIAGFDLHEIDLDSLAPKDTRATALAGDKLAWQRSKRVARIELLSPQSANLMPANNADWQGWQANYPSQTQRISNGRKTKHGAKPILGGWYSAAESTPHFAARFPRLRFFPLVPEAAISDLLKEGKPQSITLSFSATPGTQAATTFGNRSNSGLFQLYRVASTLDINKLFSGATNGNSATYNKINGEKFSASDIRYFLLCLGWAIKEEDLLSAWRNNNQAFDGLNLLVVGNGLSITGSTSIPLNFSASLHPLLEEVIAELELGVRPGGRTIPLLYRQYTVMPQPVQPVDAKDFASFLAASAPANDPYGWGVLQALGLAVTLRLFDAGRGVFLGPTALLTQVNETFSTVLTRWQTAFGADFTYESLAPFAEVLLKPGADKVIRLFDAPTKNSGGVAKELALEDDGLAMVQLSLRPQPAAVWHYYQAKLKFTPPQSAELSEVTLLLEVKNVENTDTLEVLNPEDGGVRLITGNGKLSFSLKLRSGQEPTILLRATSNKLKGNIKLTGALVASARVRLVATPGQAMEQSSDPFGRFKQPLPEAWASMLTQAGVAKTALENLRTHLRAVAPTLAFIDLSSLEEVKRIASNYLLWAQRMLDYGAAQRLNSGEIYLALAAPSKATPWRVAADAFGRVKLNIPSDDRWAHTRAYAVQPISRYQNLMLGAGVIQQAESDELILPKLKAEVGYALAVTHRTERIEAPMIIGSSIQQTNSWEVVLARHGEESMAISNRPLFARLGKPEVLLKYQRAYRTPEWPKKLHSLVQVTQEDKLPSPDLLPAHLGKLPNRSDLKQTDSLSLLNDTRLAQYASTYPSLWKGAEIFGVKTIPPHYRMLAMAVARAGVVVSNISFTMQDDLPRKPLRGQNTVLHLQDQGPRVELVANAAGETEYKLCHRMVSHADLTPDYARHWFDQANKEEIAWWPDPDVVYAVQHHCKQGSDLFIDEDAEIRLIASKEREPILVRARGVRWQAAQTPVLIQAQLQQSPSPKDAPWLFSLTTQFQRHKDSKTPFSLALTKDEVGDDLANLTAFDTSIMRFGIVLVSLPLTFNLLRLQIGPNQEPEQDYINRMKALVTEINEPRQRLFEAFESIFDTRQLKEDYAYVCRTVSEWFANQVFDQGVAQRFSDWANLPEQAKIKRYLDGLETRLWPVNRAMLPELEQPADILNSQFLLWLRDTPVDDEIEKIVDSALPLVAPESRFWQLVRQRITGGADLYLRAVDSRAKFSEVVDGGQPSQIADGVVSVKMDWPAWLEQYAPTA